jgi:GNAT superfamily N-acetyltransferase
MTDLSVPVAAPGARLRPVPFADPDVQHLVEEVQAYYVSIYGGPDDSPIDDGEFEPPSGTFVLATDATGPVGMGGWRHRPDLRHLFDASVAEVKRMYVTPRARRRGISGLVLADLERSATAAGVELLVLETGAVQEDAVALYTSCGYTRTLDFGHYAESDLSRCYAKRLSGAGTPPPPEGLDVP